jgi:hypothetical protein
MSDTLAGLTRRVNALAFDQETASELTHILDEARDHGGCAADALIEMVLAAESYSGDCMTGDDYDAIVDAEDDEGGAAVQVEFVDGREYEDGDVDPDEEAAVDADLDALAGDLADADDDTAGLGEAAGPADFEALVL